MTANPLANAFAGGTIAVALLQALRDKGVLTPAEARGVAEAAYKALGPGSPDEMQAKRLIGDLIRDRFPATGG
jgi:hypothetical protein